MPRNYTRKSTRATSYTKEALDIAIQKINQKELTYAAASKMYGIPTSTLSDRVLKKTAIVSNSLGRPTAIPIELENKLAQCLRTMEKWGWGLSREEVLDVTQEFVKRNKFVTPFKDGRPGSDWFISFRQRHKLSIKKPQPVEYLRKKMTDPFIVHEYFTLLEKTLKELNLTDPKYIWNLDETSVCLDPTKTKVVGAKGEPCTRTTCGSAKENITVLTTVNAAGQKLDPLIVFKGKHMYEQWMVENPEKFDFNLSYSASKRGWMETDIFYNYMLNIIIPNLGEERPVLLLYDGHVSHIDDKVVGLAVENNITIVKLPAHTSHLLQPLDLAVFKSFKTIWDKKLVKWQRQNVGVKLRKQCFANMFAEAWQDTKPEVIRNGFKKGGIYPFNAAIIPKEKFDPAAYTRWQKHISQATVKQPTALKDLCLNEINKALSYNNSLSALSNPVVQSETMYSPILEVIEPIENSSQTATTTFEELLLEKVAQHPQNTKNNMAVKLKRVAKGGEVITKTFIEKQQETEINKGKEKVTQKTTKRNQKSQSQKYSDEPIPGPSGTQKKILRTVKVINDVPILIDKTNNDGYTSIKGKGVGKKTRKLDKENFTTKEGAKGFSSLMIHSTTDLLVPNSSKINNKPKTKKSRLPNKGNKPAQKRTTKKKDMDKYKTSSTTSESIEMSEHSDSDLLDLSDIILSDCDTWTESTKYEDIKTESKLLSRQQEIEQIVKEINELESQVQTKNTCEKNNAIEEIQENNDSKEINIQKSVKKVTVLSSVKLTPENQVFYKTNVPLQLKHIHKDLDLFTNPKRKIMPDISDIPKKIKKVKSTAKRMTKSEKKSDSSGNADDRVLDLEKYDVSNTVLVRYFKNSWRYYVGVIEEIKTNPKLYTISYYKTIGKKNNLKFVVPKKKDEDFVPESNVVKKIELLQIKEDPVEFTLMNVDDEYYF